MRRTAHRGEGEGRSEERGMDGEGVGNERTDRGRTKRRGCGPNCEDKENGGGPGEGSKARTADDMFRAVTPGGTREVPFCGAAQVAA